DHLLNATSTLGLSLRKQAQMRHLRRNEKHRRGVLARGHTGAAADTFGGVHGLIGVALRHGNSVAVLSRSGVDRYVAACLDNLVEGRTVYHQVFDNRECLRLPRLKRELVAVLELMHVQLAYGRPSLRRELATVRRSV